MASAFVPVANAEEFLGLQIHGFGGWYYGRSSDLQFLGAETGGSAETAQFALNISAKPADRLTIVSQVNLQESREGGKVQLDYAFVDFDIASRMKIRAGRAKHPWGIYGEIFDVGTARPFLHLSQAVYGPVGFTAKAYNGVGITGSVGGQQGKWGLQYDVYGGEIDGDYEDSGLFSMQSTDLPQKFSFRSLNKNVVGTRIQVNTPIEGLWIGGSAYTGSENVTGFATRQKIAYLGSLEYLNDRFLVRAESGYFDAEDEYDGDARFVELAYKITPQWQVATRWDQFHLELFSFRNLPLPPWVAVRWDVTHTERIVGVNYWFNPNVVIRASVGQVKGPRLLYPTPEQLEAYIQTGIRPKDETNVLMLGAQFSF
jgi:hypothetical protein